MNRTAIVTCTGLLVGVLCGCAQSGATVRAQSPVNPDVAAHGPVMGSAPGYGQHSKRRHKDFAPLSGYTGGHFGDGSHYSSPAIEARVSPYPASPQGHCPPSGGHCGPYGHTTYNFQQPQGLSYPTDQMPAGLVQYPYYTLRGPTDFFMK